MLGDKKFNGMSRVEKKGIKLTILFYAPRYSAINCQIFILNYELVNSKWNEN